MPEPKRDKIELGEITMRRAEDYMKGRSGSISFVCPKCKTRYTFDAREVRDVQDKLQCVFDKTMLERDTEGPPRKKSVIERMVAKEKKEAPKPQLAEKKIVFFHKEHDPVCRAASATLLKELEGKNLITLDPVDESDAALIAAHGVKSFPTILFFCDGVEVARLEGIRISAFSIHAALELL